MPCTDQTGRESWGLAVAKGVAGGSGAATERESDV